MKAVLARIAIAASASALALATPGYAQAQQLKDGLDTNGDGALNVEEFVMAMGAREFSRSDANGDNIMSVEEWLQGGDFRKMTEERFNTDGDDIMSGGELVEIFLWVFGNRDKDKDGNLTVAEVPPFLLAQ